MLGKNRAQVGETMTWIVATIVIVAILIVSIFTTSLLANTKKTISYKKYERTHDLIMEKSVFAYFLSEDADKKVIFDWMQEQEEKDLFYADFKDEIENIEDNLK